VILCFGYGDDPSLAQTIDAARQKGADLLVVDQRQLTHVNLLVEDITKSSGYFEVRGARMPLSEIEAVYARPLSAVAVADAEAHARGRALVDLVVEWLDVAPGRIVNRPSSMTSNSSKPLQAQLIAGCGWAIPPTLVTNVPNEVRRFAERHPDVVFKSTSGIRSIVRVLDQAACARLEQVRVLPTQFQARVCGTDLRVHVVGSEVFATEITSDAVDYRYAAHDGNDCRLRAVTIDDELAGRCVDLARRLHLPFAGLDLRRRPDGEIVCFEVNPMPGYSFYEAETGQPISAALVRYLTGKAE
jgi:hypothetical protein